VHKFDNEKILHHRIGFFGLNNIQREHTAIRTLDTTLDMDRILRKAALAAAK
jgi:hypothetical protein